MNYSSNAEENNDENVIIIDNAEIARLYLQEFDRVWNLASDPELETIACG
jgi:phosphatidylserine/phosphatidylglycerophosphate/cardiolipin synthase-like enzyme